MGESIGLTDWQPASSETFAQAQVLDLPLLDSDFVARWMDGMHAYGLHNAGVLALREQENAKD